MYLLVDSGNPVLIDVILLQPSHLLFDIFFRKSSIYILSKLGVSINKIQYILLLRLSQSNDIITFCRYYCLKIEIKQDKKYNYQTLFNSILFSKSRL
jgi:hypothetical protein